MRLYLKESEVIFGAFILEVDLKMFSQRSTIPKDSIWMGYDFVRFLDERFIYPFDMRRLGPWRNDYSTVKSYFTYVAMPEGFQEYYE
jgi:hypothetical protein